MIYLFCRLNICQSILKSMFLQTLLLLLGEVHPGRSLELSLRSPSPAVNNPHSTSRAESPASHRDSLCASNDDEFNNSPSEDNQDSVPDNEIQDVSETHSEVSADDIKFQTIVQEVFKLLPADMFPQKSEDSSGGNRPKSSIELEMQKVTKKSTSLPQSRRPLMKAVDCLKES